MVLSTLTIDSDITGRFKRILAQLEFESELTFLTELLQNCQRAQATTVSITHTEDRLSITDNGTGCQDPKDLFTLDLSGFGVGFGEGFSSVYTLLGTVSVETLDWSATLDVAALAQKASLRKEDLALAIQPIPYRAGFTVTVTGGRLPSLYDQIQSEIRAIAVPLKDLSITLNGERLESVDLLAPVPNQRFQQLFKNPIYEGRLYTDSTYYHQGVHIYYEDRFVDTLHSIGGLSGVILIRPDQITLKAPDRKSIIRDEKRFRLIEQLENDLKTLVLRVLREGDDEAIEAHAETIRYLLPIEQTMRYLQFDPRGIRNQYETRKAAKPLQEPPVADVSAEPEESSVEAAPPIDTTRTANDETFSSSIALPARGITHKEDLATVTISTIKRKNNVVWVQKRYLEEYQELVDQYEYYGIFTFISPHGLYDDALSHLGVPHIALVEDEAISKDYDVRSIGARNKKEQRALELLSLIERHFSLPETFVISTISCKMTVQLNEKRIFQQPLPVTGYARGSSIHLDRTSLLFGKLSGASLHQPKLGLHDVKFILANLEVIAHELAHLLYFTQDNTKTHFERIIEIQQKIGQFVLTHSA